MSPLDRGTDGRIDKDSGSPDWIPGQNRQVLPVRQSGQDVDCGIVMEDPTGIMKRGTAMDGGVDTEYRR